MLTVTKNVKFIFVASCVCLGGCYNTPDQLSTKEKTVLFLTERSFAKVPPVQNDVQKPFHYYFIPPQGWDLADMSKLSHRMKICFLGKSSHNLLPSVSLATEEVDISLKTYIDIVKTDCERDPNSVWRDLGKYNTPLGEGRLTEREVKTQWGVSRQIQLIVIKDHRAYVLTAGALKEEFSRHYQAFEAVLKSLTITEDLTASLTSLEKKELLQKLIGNLQTEFAAAMNTSVSATQAFESKNFQKEFWKPFQQKIINDFTEMGAYWQILLLRDVQHQLFKRPT